MGTRGSPKPTLPLKLVRPRKFDRVGFSAAAGPLAQSVEQRTFNPWVVGSIPTGPTKKKFHNWFRDFWSFFRVFMAVNSIHEVSRRNS
jgi:hypothetical protein